MATPVSLSYTLLMLFRLIIDYYCLKDDIDTLMFMIICRDTFMLPRRH